MIALFKMKASNTLLSAFVLFVIALTILNPHDGEVCATYTEKNLGIKTKIYHPEIAKQSNRQYDANNYYQQHEHQQQQQQSYYPDNYQEEIINASNNQRLSTLRGEEAAVRENYQTSNVGYNNKFHKKDEYFTTCPEKFTGQLAYASDCRSFLNCYNGQGQVQPCAPGTLFNAHILTCDRADNVQCNNMNKSPSARLLSLAPKNLNELCPKDFNGLRPYPEDCTKFINCAHGTAYLQNCGPGTAYNAERMFCDFPHKVNCGNRYKELPNLNTASNIEVDNNKIAKSLVTAENTFDHAEEVKRDLFCPNGMNGLFPHPFDNTRFINCHNGQTGIQNCEYNKVYSISQRRCVEKNHNFGPNDHVTYNIAEVDYKNPLSLVKCPPGTEGLYMYPFTEKKTCQCSSSGDMQITDCPNGYQFDMSSQSCQQIYSASQNLAFISPINAYSAASLECPVDSSKLFYPYPFDGSKYISCRYDKYSIENCQPGYLFSLLNRQCRSARTLSFNDYVTVLLNGEQNMPNIDVDTIIRSGKIMCPLNVNGNYLHPFDCTKYLHCREGQIMVDSCLNGSVFSITQRRCVIRDHVEANDRVDYWSSTQHEFSDNQILRQQETNKDDEQRPPIYIAECPPGKTFNLISQQCMGDAPIYSAAHGQHNGQDNENWYQRQSKELTDHVVTAPTTQHNVLHMEGSLQPHNTYYREQTGVYSAPLAPITPIFSRNTTTSSVYYAQPVGSQENSEEIFNNNPTANRAPYPYPYPFPNSYAHEQQSQQVYPYTDSHIRPIQTPDQQKPLNHGPSSISADIGQRPLQEVDLTQQTETNIYYDHQRPLYFSSDPYDTQQPIHTNYESSSKQHTQTETTTARNVYYQPPLAHIAPMDSAIPISQIHYASNNIQYSPTYSEVKHSRNDNVRKPQEINHQQHYSNRSPKTTEVHEDDDVQLNNPAISEALRILLKPYMPQNASGELTQQAGVHIMSLVSQSALTTTPDPRLQSTSGVINNDAEFLVAGEQNHLTGNILHQQGSYPSSKSNAVHTEQERSFSHPDYEHHHSHYHYPHYHHHNHHYNNFEHSSDFHNAHPHLPNPFEQEPTDDTATTIINLLNSTTNPNTPQTSFSVKPVDNCAFDCKNGLCIQKAQVCDGVNDCTNNEDEGSCEHLGYEVRLTGGSAPNMGRVEVKIMDKWGYVCDDKFGLRDADVLCRELGFNSGASEVRGNSFYPPSNSNPNFMMDEVECLGNETSLRQCDFRGWGVHNCESDEVVGVVCKVPLLKCPNNYWLCSTSHECIPLNFVCDNTGDCADKSDESQEVCHSPVQYRLEGGRSANEGRLEVLYRGMWGTVCDDDFGMDEAQVACNSLGYFGKPRIDRNIYGPGSGAIWLDQVACFGNESTLEQCSHSALGEHNCNHTEDVGLYCTVGPPPSRTAKGSPRLSTSSTIYVYANDTLNDEDIGLYSAKDAKQENEFKRCGRYSENLTDEFLHPEQRVVNGTRAKRGRHPWQATIRARGVGGISSHWCGAVLISRQHLLTAAHCLVGSARDSYFVRLGDHYSSISEGTEKDAFIERWYIHEEFREGAHMNNDIALIVLKRKITFNDYIQPICLPIPSNDTKLETNRLCTISGWGSIKSGISTPSTTLRAAQVPILPDDLCRQEHVYGNSITNGMFCAGTMDESVDACDGDSGGPLACSDEGVETLYGIISWGQHCGFANKPGVYVRIEKYIDWIYDKINLSLQHVKKH